MTDYDLHETARALVAEGKGILAADESGGTIKKRFDSIGLESTEENRRAYRDMLFTTPGVEDYISGVILFDETIRQQALDGTPFPELLASKGIIPGIKVDEGAKPLAGAEGETVTEGLDGLRARWRSTAASAHASRSGVRRTRSPCAPERLLHLDERARARALRGALPGGGDRADRRAGGPAGGTHTIERSYHVTCRVLAAVYTELYDRRSTPRASLLKPNMVLSGYSASGRAGVEEVADWTLKCFYKHVPAAVPGIVFLSGGQSDEDATAHMNAMNAKGPHPWEISFSYGRALQAPAIKAWGGKAENVEAGQRAYYHRAKMNSTARTGAYAPAMEQEAVAV